MKQRITLNGYTMRGHGINFPNYIYTDEFGDIDYNMVAEKIANKNGMVAVTCRPDGQDKIGDKWVSKYVATLGHPVSTGGYSPESEIRFDFGN